MMGYERIMTEITTCLDYCEATGCRWAFVWHETLKEIKDALDKAKRGEWVEYPKCLAYDGAYSKDHIVCSRCGHVWSIMDNDTETFNYCPNCGAMMVEEGKQ